MEFDRPQQGRLNMHESKIIRTSFAPSGTNGISKLAGHPDIPVGSLSAVAEDVSLWSAPAMLLAAAESCFYLTLQNVAAKMRVGIKSYASETIGTITYADGRHGEFSEITIKPSIALEDDAQNSRIPLILQMAEEYCYVARSLKCPVTIET
jgi:organic hydroperoxide reductase OsmC/OhrA